MRVILASASPRRAELLTAAGYTFDVLPVGVDESVLPEEEPSAYVRRLAAAKSGLALTRIHDDGGHAFCQDVIILGADTAVIVDGRILGKPHDDAEARRMLERLSDRAHRVMTGVSVRTATRPSEAGAVETTTVWFSRLSPEEIAWYIDSGEGHDKAGAYAIQGLASRFVQRIEGSYSNVVGLPLAVVHTLFSTLSAPATR